MAKYFCQEHGVVFFKKGKMKGYAHPIDNTDNWCNMPEGTEPMAEEDAPVDSDKMSKEDWAAKDSATKASILYQVCLKELGLCVREGKIDKTTGLGKFLNTYYYTTIMEGLGIHYEGGVDKETK